MADPDIKHVKSEEYYEVIIRLTPSEYNVILNNALWGNNSGIAGYIKDSALGKQRKGC